MKTIAETPRISRRSDRPTFSVVAIYEDFSAGIRAQEALVWLAHSLGDDLQITPFAWSFRNLERLDVRAMAVRAAAAADVIIISASATELVPNHIKRWLDTSLKLQRDGRAVLVALHDDDDQTPCNNPGALCPYLEHEASRWQTDFMCNKDFDQRLDREFAMQCAGHKRHDSVVLSHPSERHCHSWPVRWGINE